jgi:molybdopterin-containing oxidoreductase family iron-sulfur binding subunit
MRRSNGRIVPYVIPPENAHPERPEYYATAVPVEGYARGILVESILGRPTKIEGNPDHPESLGATDAATQAAILDLYDPDRSRVPLRAGLTSTREVFAAEWAQFLSARPAGQARIALLTEPTTSPSLLREVGLMLDAFPNALWFQHTPLASYEVDGLQPDYDFSKAGVILSVGSDCLYRHPACVRYARGYAAGRRVVDGRIAASRFYAIESSPSVTGVLADVRLPASPPRMRVIMGAIDKALLGNSSWQAGLGAQESDFVGRLARDLRANGQRALCVAGEEQPMDVRRWTASLNGRLGSEGSAFRWLASARSDSNQRSRGDARALRDAIAGGAVEALVVLSSNPAYTSVALRGVIPAISKLPFSVHLGAYADETAGACAWHLPEAHFLECWGDLRAYDGTASVLQPLIEPMWNGLSALEVVRILRSGTLPDSYQIVRECWRDGAAGDFDERWNRWVRLGVADSRAAAGARAPRGPVAAPDSSTEAPGLSLLLAPDSNVLDGRSANNAWLQELPRPLTRLVWDNAALVSPSLASRLGVEDGDVIRIAARGGLVEAPALVMPGQATDCIAISIGYGRWRAGSVGNGVGFDAYQVRPDDGTWGIEGIEVTTTGRRHRLVTTQHHFAIEGRNTVRTVDAVSLVLPKPPPRTSLYGGWPRNGNAWGMSIDLSTCIGCSACVLACQAENNIPVVGKDQVSRGREMHWIRVDKYFEGAPDNPRFLSEPVPCMQCENAPCELVCPVGATVHSSEGLNDMVYNRCVGTRYCSNNCPYKVRRFNFLNYRAPADSIINLQKNPNVTVRERGVMEKCTYCVQRINAARIDAERENRPIRDGEILTACQQACPAEAIVFGNIADPSSRVSARKAEPTDYSLLEELNTRPRTTYLAKVLNVGETAS